MNQQEAQVLIDAIKGLVTHDPQKQPAKVVATGVDSRLVRPAATTNGDNEKIRLTNDQLEYVYRFVKGRLLDELSVDPIFLTLVEKRQSIEVEFTRNTVRLDGDTLQGRVARLMAQGWFAEPRATGAVRRELARIGADPGGSGNLSMALSKLKKDGFLVDAGGSYQLAPGIRVTEKEIASA